MRIKGLLPRTIWELLTRRAAWRADQPALVFFCLCDHYEPMWNDATATLQRERVDRWIEGYPRLFGRFRDSAGRPPQHTFFYPAEEYQAEHLDKLAGLCHDGWGDVEVHLHHDNDTAENLRATLLQFTTRLHDDHGLLQKDASGQITYAFIHGNWALDNSRPDGRWCGVNNELSILRETGCYADFTMPSAPSDTQTSTINSIYYAIDDPQRPKSHDRGIRARVGEAPPDDGLLMVQGPLALNWKRRKAGLLPRVENADLHGGFGPDLLRLRLWLQTGVGVAGRPDWFFIKLHTHGAPEKNASLLLGEPMQQFHADLARFAQSHPNLRYYYVTAREMVDLIHQAERGSTGPVPGSHRGATHCQP